MSKQTWVETLITAPAAGPQLSNTVTATSLLPTTSKFVLPANFFEPGRQLVIEASGNLSCVVTTPGSLTMDVRLNSVIAFTSSAMNLNVVAKSTVPWWMSLTLTCLTAGSGTTATLIGTGQFTSEALVGAPLPTVGGSATLLMPVTIPIAGTGFDSSTSQILDVFGKFSVATNPTNITLQQFTLKALN